MDERCPCSRSPEGHAAPVDLTVYGKDGERVENLSMRVCHGVVEGYVTGIRAGLISGRIEASLVGPGGYRFPAVRLP